VEIIGKKKMKEPPFPLAIHTERLMLVAMIYLTKRDPEKNQQRFYGLHITPTLFGGWSLVREWGRIGQSGTLKIETFPTEEEARQKLEQLQAQKVKRGYTHHSIN
jgi:predicted DNA-binding WGR domain protein